MSSHESRESHGGEPLKPDRLNLPADECQSGDALPIENINPTKGVETNSVDAGTGVTRTEVPVPGFEHDLGNGDDDGSESGERWDANDPRRKHDCFAPPMENCECHCLHCGRTFPSDTIWFQNVINDPQGFKGFWMCPTANCSGAGFTFDIFPVDPNHPANEGWVTDDDEEELDMLLERDDEAEDEAFDLAEEADGDESDEYDPSEPHYQEMEDFFGDGDDDLEGEEWKYGLAPGERPPEPPWRQEAREEWEEDQKKYNEPDQRPRTLDWSNREDRSDENYYRSKDDRRFSDDDIPF